LQNSDIFSAEELQNLRDSIGEMIRLLDSACLLSHDPPSIPPAIPNLVRRIGGRRGRPQIVINSQFLEEALPLTTQVHLSQLLQCSARTVRQCALSQRLMEPGGPVFLEYTDAEGNVVRVHSHSSTRTQVQDLNDHQLDFVLRQILEIFPSFGRTMLMGQLKHQGHTVTRERLRESYIRVQGLPPAFGRRRIQRRVYSVAGPNSLWHHDGQHGKLVLDVNGPS
jgi:hypothetical protein